MADDYYPDQGGDQGAADQGDQTSDTPDAQTALLPKTIFGDKPLEVGSECTFKIEHVYNDEVEVSYVPHDEGQEEAPADAMSGMEQSQGQLGAMAQ
jgi:hypothetical protein